jgi:hypothetical protein
MMRMTSSPKPSATVCATNARRPSDGFPALLPFHYTFRDENARGSSKTFAAVLNEIPCFARFVRFLSSFQTKRNM